MGVSKEKLLKMLNEALVLEEKSVPLYSRHLKTAMFWSGLDAASREQLRIQLGILAQESDKHGRVIASMIEKIKRDTRDVF